MMNGFASSCNSNFNHTLQTSCGWSILPLFKRLQSLKHLHRVKTRSGWLSCVIQNFRHSLPASLSVKFFTYSICLGHNRKQQFAEIVLRGIRKIPGFAVPANEFQTEHNIPQTCFLLGSSKSFLRDTDIGAFVDEITSNHSDSMFLVAEKLVDDIRYKDVTCSDIVDFLSDSIV